MQLPQQIKTLIHHVLHRHKFYRLQITQYYQILELLNQPRTEDPHLIQQYTFLGIVIFNINHKDQIAPVFANPAYAHVSIDSKALLHRILHEFHFLNSIRAYEMFQQRFQQPASLTHPHTLQGMPFDDQLEKAKLHYMYYGPYSVYSMGGMLPQQQPSPFSQNFFPPPSNNHFFNNDQPIHISKQKIRPITHSEIFAPQEKSVMPTRGRPPKDKKKQQERISAQRISEPLRQYLLSKYNEYELLQQRDEQLQFCLCRGFLKESQSYRCPQCHFYFHTTCTKSCLACIMRNRDPFSRVVEAIGTFYLDWWAGEFSFEEEINVKSLQRVCSTGRFEIMVSCMSPQREDLTWPDGTVLSINNQQVFQIPPLLIDHNVAHRKDTAYFITRYIFDSPRSDSGPNFQRVKLSLEAKGQQSEHYRDNRKGIFLLGIFLVEKVPVQTLMTSIIAENRAAAITNPLDDGNQDEDLAIDHLAVSCLDPYSQKLIQTPVRGRNCLHYNCFDLQTYLTLQHHSRERRWRCPICGSDARSLIVDKFQLRVIQEIRDLPELPSKVMFYKNGKIDLQQRDMCAQVARDSQS